MGCHCYSSELDNGAKTTLQLADSKSKVKKTINVSENDNSVCAGTTKVLSIQTVLSVTEVYQKCSTASMDVVIGSVVQSCISSYCSCK